VKHLIFHIGRLKFRFEFNPKDLSLKISFTDLKLILESHNIPWKFEEDKACKKN